MDIIWLILLIDLLFWSVVLAAGWWIIKKLNKPLNLKNNLPIKPLVLLLIIASVIGGALVWKRKVPLISTAIPTPTPYKTYPSILNFNFYPSHEIKKQRFGPGSYNTEGYVVKMFTCPPCPTRVLCKPCMGENIVISEESKILTDYSSLTDNELIIFAQNPKQFQLGKKYQFSIQIIKNKRTTFDPVNDIELLGYKGV